MQTSQQGSVVEESLMERFANTVVPLIIRVPTFASYVASGMVPLVGVASQSGQVTNASEDYFFFPFKRWLLDVETVLGSMERQLNASLQKYPPSKHGKVSN